MNLLGIIIGILGLALTFLFGGIQRVRKSPGKGTLGRIDSKSDTDMEDNIQLDEAKVARFLTILKDSRRDAIGFRFTESDSNVPVGSTKYGGRPDAPAGFEWPVDERDRPLSFLFQINCAEVAPYDEKRQLPEQGLLAFYFQLDYDIDWHHMERYARVLYFDVPSAMLFRADFPEILPEEYRAQEHSVKIYRKDSYPDFEDFLHSNLNNASFKYDQLDNYDAAREQLEPRFSEEDPGLIATSLGYAMLIQGSIIDDFDSNVLLFQINSDEKNPEGIMFGDAGALYFYISRDDLRERRFDRITFDMQCY